MDGSIDLDLKKVCMACDCWATVCVCIYSFATSRCLRLNALAGQLAVMVSCVSPINFRPLVWSAAMGRLNIH